MTEQTTQYTYRRQAIVLLLGCALLTGCATHKPPALIDQLGGKAGVTDIVDAFLVEMSEDPVVVDSFNDTDIEAFREHLINQICELAGGNCIYEGRSMAESHADLDVDSRQFNALVADLMDAMDTVGVPLSARNQLLGMLAPMHGDIVD